MSCAPERVTALADMSLDATAVRELETHLLGCAACREQLEAERWLRARLRALPRPEPRDGFTAEVRARLRRPRPRRLRYALAAAAGLLLAAWWLRGSPDAASFLLARDHAHCFGMQPLPARVWSSDPRRVIDWFAAQGTELPSIPAGGRGLELVGARYCPLLDATQVAHVYYAAAQRRLSVFLLPRRLRLAGTHARRHGTLHVRLIAAGDATLGLAGDARDVEAFERSLTTSVAELGAAAALP